MTIVILHNIISGQWLLVTGYLVKWSVVNLQSQYNIT